MAGIKAYRGPSTTPEGEALTELTKLKILNGQLLTVTFAATNNVIVRHSLGRPYTGAIVVASSDSTAYPGVTAFSASAFARTGGDPTKFVVLGCASPYTATLTVWVF